MRAALLVVAVLWLAIVDLSARGDWVVLENCRLVLNPANDGDSFHVSSGDKEYVLRLYLVDTPEIDGTDPARLIEQAKFFEITVPQAIEVGETAKDFVREKLSEPFTVFTRMSDAMGRSKIERLYALVQTKEGDLGEQLIRSGLARVFGNKVAPPGSDSSQAELAKLEQFEDQARKDKIGGWGIKSDGLHKRPVDKPPFSFFAKPGHASPTPTALASPTSPAPAKLIPSSAGKLDINVATKEQLEDLPGVGPVLADEIIGARPFRSADDLRDVKGVGEKRYEKLRPYFEP
jgi:DNA uptake protein ComE-like DNA-binding protein